MSSFMKSGQKVPKLFIYIHESGPNSIRIIIFILIVSGNVVLTNQMKYDSMYSHPQKEMQIHFLPLKCVNPLYENFLIHYYDLAYY